MKKYEAPDVTAEPSSWVGGDRLSSLPDELIGRILSFLPTPQAVLMAQLSRRWRRVWAHVTALNLSVRDCVPTGRFCAVAAAALARFPTPDIPSISVEVDHHIDEWYGQAMARAVGSVRVASLQEQEQSFLRLPPCTRAESLHVTAPRTTLTLPLPGEEDLVFGRLAELSLALLHLGGADAGAGARPLDEFLASCCPRLRTLRLRRVSGHPLRRLALHKAALEVLDLDTVDDLTTLDVVAVKLRWLSVRSCFRGGGEVTISAPRIEAVCWYASYPQQLTFGDGDLAHVRRLAGPLNLATIGPRDQLDAPYKLLRSCALAVDRLDMELVVPDEIVLLIWHECTPEVRATMCDDLIRHVPVLPCVRELSLKIRWGIGHGRGGVAPCVASFLSRTPSLTRLQVEASSYCVTVYEGEEAAAPRRKQQKWKRSDVVGGGAYVQQRVRLDGLREMSIDGLKGTDSEERRLVELLLASAPPSLERMSLTFRDAAASIVDEIAAEILVHFPMAATGRWDRCTTSVLTWTRVECTHDDRTASQSGNNCIIL